MIIDTKNPEVRKGNKGEHGSQALPALFGLVGVGLVPIVLFSLQATGLIQVLSISGVSVIIAGAALLSGALLGFLFGIPRILRQSPPAAPAVASNTSNVGGEPKTSVATSESEVLHYQPNTNLEEISDWFTKILVGVGLTQLSTVPARLQAFADYAAAGLGGFPSSGIFAIGTLIYNLVCGFLIGYLWTRLYLAGAFREADEVAALKKIVHDLVDQQQLDAHALGLVEHQLAVDSNKSEILQAELNKAIASASEPVKTQIFYRVDLARPDKDNNPGARAARARTLPILHALVESDSDNRWDESRVLLAIALMEQESPDWGAANRLLDKAIEIRDKRVGAGSTAGRWYEFYRAKCRMALDPNLAQKSAADDARKQQIQADLDAASKWRDVDNAKQVENANPKSVMKDWLAVNNVTW